MCKVKRICRTKAGQEAYGTISPDQNRKKGHRGKNDVFDIRRLLGHVVLGSVLKLMAVTAELIV